MSLLNRLRSRLAPMPRAASGTDPERPLATAERLLRSGGAAAEIAAAAAAAQPANDVELAWAELFAGNVEQAQSHAYAAASARPYDVDSRIVHGTVRLARHELEHAAHEFDAVIEEFGAEADAANGRRAVILAHGFAPLDDLPASAEEWHSAAVLLTTLWRVCNLASARQQTLAGGSAEGWALLAQALADGQAQDGGETNGTV